MANKKRIRSLTIDRAKWGKSLLLDSANKQMCCLGHLGQACGVPTYSMEDIGTPRELGLAYESLYPKAFVSFHPSRATNLATRINDDNKMSIPEKERRLIILFGAYRIKLSFIGDRRLAGV